MTRINADRLLRQRFDALSRRLSELAAEGKSLDADEVRFQARALRGILDGAEGVVHPRPEPVTVHPDEREPLREILQQWVRNSGRNLSTWSAPVGAYLERERQTP